MKDFTSTRNITFSWEERLRTHTQYNLYVSDCFWVFEYNNYFEFYYNPEYFIGKIKKEQMPEVVVERIKSCSIVFTNGQIDYGLLDQKKLHNSLIRLRKLEKDMRIGNWFYAQGQNYVTWKGLFICDDVYVEGAERECSIKDINGGAVFDMIRMVCRTRTPNYIRGLFDLSVFQGIDVSRIKVCPFDEFWDDKQWAKDFKELSEHFQRYKSRNDMDIIKGMRTEVFLHTVSIIQEGKYSLYGRLFEIPKDESEKMINNTIFYSQNFSVVDVPVCGEETKIVVENGDCLSVARKMQSYGYNVAVLNMASRQNPGGGVIGGAGAQEENLFRRTNLFQSMFRYAHYATQYGLKQSESQYPLDRNYGGIYTPDALVLRGEEKDGYPLLGEESFRMSFISVPGMNRPELTAEGLIVDSLIEPIKNKMRTILRIGLRHGHDSLVLGALGCGAFCNPPSHIAKLFHEVFEEPEFKNKYRLISFAILDDHNSHRSHNPEGNYIPFEKEFSND